MGNTTNRIFTVGNLLEGYSTTATAAGTTTLTVTSNHQQFFTGTTTQTVVLPVASTLVLGQQFLITNNSTGIVTVQSSGANTIQAMAASSSLLVTCILTSGTTGASWSAQYTILSVTATIQPTIQKFTSSSGTYTTPTGVQYIVVRAVGGGGGGAGSGNGAAGTGGSGGTTSFGTSLLSAPGGGGAAYAVAIVSGGTATISAPAIGSAFTGATGSAGNYNNGVQAALNGAPGGGSILFGGAGGGGLGNAAAGTNGITNTGGGGGGGGGGNNITGYTGTGGGGGSSLEAIIASPSATYSYSIGIAGTSGTAGTSGFAGGAGGSGYIEVTEYYNNLAVGSTSSVAANVVFAGPSSGATANPGFRALVAADISVIRSQITLQGSTGYGATNTKIKRMTTQLINTGSDITYTASSTNGDSYTINTAGVYSIHLNDGYASGACQIGISLNSAQLTTNIASITAANRVAYGQGPATGVDGSTSTTWILAVNDVIRVHGDGNGNSAQAQFTIARVN